MQMNQWPDVKAWAEQRQWPDVKGLSEHVQWPAVKGLAEHVQWPDVKGWAGQKQWPDVRGWSARKQPAVTSCPSRPPWRQRRRWSDLSGVQKVWLIIMAAVQVGLLVAGLWDLAHRKPDEVRGPKAMWWGIMFVNWIGPIAYFTFGRKSGVIQMRADRSGGPGGHVDGTEETAEFAGPAVI